MFTTPSSMLHCMARRIQLPAAHPPPCLPASPWTPRGLLWAPFGALRTPYEGSPDPLWAPLGALWRPSASQGSSLNAQCDENINIYEVFKRSKSHARRSGRSGRSERFR